MLTTEEKQAILTATDLQINVCNMRGTFHIEYHYPDGKRWPTQIVADVRGVKKVTENDQALLTEVAEELGYDDKESYNDACRLSPQEVVDRIYELKLWHF